MSRRKSFKKSLRESFRRLRKGRSQRPSTSGPKSTPTSPISKVEDQSSNNAGPSISAEVRPVERQIEARNVDDGMGSMVRCLLMVKTFVISQSVHASATVWAGTNSGAIYVFSLSVPAGLDYFQLFFPSFQNVYNIYVHSTEYFRKQATGRASQRATSKRNSAEASSTCGFDQHNRRFFCIHR